MYFDSHAHYDDEAFDGDREDVLRRLPGDGVESVVNMGCDTASSRKAAELAEKYSYIWAAAGIHPENAEEYQDGDLDKIEELLKLDRVVAIGEIGLDYYRETPGRERQKALFRAQMDMAARLGMPVCVHDREAHGDSMDIIRRYPGVRGVFHCFSGSVETARELVNLGWYIGFTGAVTFKNARKLPQVAASIPRERILIETDCPYMAPEPMRGRRCDSSMLKWTLGKIASIRGENEETLARAVADNTRQFYKL